MKTTIALLCLLMLSACGAVPNRIIAPGAGGWVEVTGNKDAGKPATLTSGEVRSGFRVPANSKLTVTRIEAHPASEGEPAAPAREVSVWEFSEPTEFEQVASSLSADTGTVDTSVAKHRIDVEERGKLLWVAVACGVAGMIAKVLLKEWPAIGNGLLAAGAVAFGAWKLAEIPAWLWAAILGGVALIVIGYKRAEWDRDGNGIPDILERKKSNQPAS